MEVNDWNAVHAYEDAARVSDAMAQRPVECAHPVARSWDINDGKDFPFRADNVQCDDCGTPMVVLPADVVAHQEEAVRLLRVFLESMKDCDKQWIRDCFDWRTNDRGTRGIEDVRLSDEHLDLLTRFTEGGEG